VQLRGRPERLLIERPGEPAVQKLGARVAARVRRIERGLGMAFPGFGEGPDAVVSGQSGVTEGAVLEVEITAEARAGKGPVVGCSGRRGRCAAPAGAGADAGGAAEAARPARLRHARARRPRSRGRGGAEALEREYALPEGGSLAIERRAG
jgi:hypothetical protein